MTTDNGETESNDIWIPSLYVLSLVFAHSIPNLGVRQSWGVMCLNSSDVVDKTLEKGEQYKFDNLDEHKNENKVQITKSLRDNTRGREENKGEKARK